MGCRTAECVSRTEAFDHPTETLACYQFGCRTRIVADASPVGLGAVLTQQQGGVWRVISYA